MAEKLKKALGLIPLTFYGVGTIVGAGIYAIIGVVAGEAGYNMWIAFVLASIAAAFSALSYAELSSSFPKAGAEYVFLSNAFPNKKVIPFITGYFITIHGTATFATVLLAFAGYFSGFFDIPEMLIAYALLAVITLFNLSGIKKSSVVNITFTSAQILGLVMLVLAGVTSQSFGNVFQYKFSLGPEIFTSVAIVFYVYTGYEHMATLAEEAKNPGRNIPLAFIFSLIFTTVIYLLIVFSALALATPEALANSRSPLALAGSNRYSWMGPVIGVAALLATANVSLSASLSVSRMMYGMSSKGDMPAIFSKLNVQKAPWVAALALAAIVGIFIPFGEIRLVASVSSLGAMLVFAFVNLAVIVLRYKRPALKRPFSVPLRIGKFPVLPAFGIIISVLLATQFSWEVYLIFGIAVALGITGYYLSSGRNGDKPSTNGPEKVWGNGDEH
ncbi:MAG TPA: amino acid permease [Sphingobacteriaceae bacterium]